MPVFTRAADSTTAEVAYTWIKNNEASTAMAAGECVVWDVTGTVGNECLRSTATNQENKVAGFVPPGESIAAGTFGRVQIYGYHSGVKSATVAASGYIKTTATAATVDDTAADTTRAIGFFWAADSGGYAAAFIHCL